jgi:hypothetical protein
MSQELVDRYLGAIDAWNRGDLETWLALAADEWHTTASFPGVEPVYRGRAGMTAIWEYLHAPWDSAANIQIDVDRVEDLGIPSSLLPRCEPGPTRPAPRPPSRWAMCSPTTTGS